MLTSKYEFDGPSAKKIVQDTFRDVPDEGLQLEDLPDFVYKFDFESF